MSGESFGESLSPFVEQLASSAPVPGGGGVAALCGALAFALGEMVCNLTKGKQKYAEVEDEIRATCAIAEQERKQFLALVDADAQCFAPLSRAYTIPKDDPEKDVRMQEALELACETPLAVMSRVAECFPLLERLADIGSRLAISDIGVAAALCRSALQSARLNIDINTAMMPDATQAEFVNARARACIREFAPRADALYQKVHETLKKK